jgi:hypothetical protein
MFISLERHQDVVAALASLRVLPEEETAPPKKHVHIIFSEEFNPSSVETVTILQRFLRKWSSLCSHRRTNLLLGFSHNDADDEGGTYLSMDCADLASLLNGTDSLNSISLYSLCLIGDVQLFVDALGRQVSLRFFVG